jgi:hypothetical protein
MAITMENLPAAEGGFEVTREMIEQWCAAYDAVRRAHQTGKAETVERGDVVAVVQVPGVRGRHDSPRR